MTRLQDHVIAFPPAPTVTKTTCPYCGVGCGVIATVDQAGAVSIAGDPDHPANFGRLCSKGAALAETLSMDGRILAPRISGQETGWDEALDLVAEKFGAAIAEHGPDSVAFYVSGQCLTEDYYVANKLMKGFFGSANIDTNSRLCMASSVAGHRRAFGTDTVPGNYEDLEEADLLVLVGSNLAWCHPVLYQRIAAARQARPELKIVVIDPRRTMTCDLADMHLMIRSDGDVALFVGLLAHLAASPAFDNTSVRAYTTGFEAALSAARKRTCEDIAEETGLSSVELRRFYDLFAGTEKVVTCYSQGVNQSAIGTDKVNAIINCHLATGRIGRPGMGPFSLTGQPNAMGGREVGGLANMLAAHMEIDNPVHRDRVRRFWQAPALAEKPGLKAVDLFEAVARGKIKALWIMATNPVVSMPDADRVRQAIADCPFVVVSDIQENTDTALLADVLLPSTGWGEKNGTVTNSERRISRQRGFLPAPGEARPDWWQMAEVARRMGFAAQFDYDDAADIFVEHARLSAFENDGERDFDIGAAAALSRAAYDRLAPFQWPHRAGEEPADSRFFADGRFFTEDRKARFVPVESRRTDRLNEAFPVLLNTGRIRDQWHTMTRTGKAPRLSSHLAEPFAEINPRDAEEKGIVEAGLVRIESAHGSVVVRALLTDRQPRGGIFVPMHWTNQFASLARVDALVAPVTDPVSGQPALKQVAVSIAAEQVALYGFAITKGTPVTRHLAYWAQARLPEGSRLELAFADRPINLESDARDRLGLDSSAVALAYDDRASGQQRIVFFKDDQLVAALYTGPAPVAVSRNWAIAQLGQTFESAHAKGALLAGRPGAREFDPGATVCSCMSVGFNQIVAAGAQGCLTVDAVGQATGAGSNCGSCRAEIRGILDGIHRQAAE